MDGTLSRINTYRKEHKRKSVSLHDISSLQPSLLNANIENGISCETLLSHSLSSTTKSKDSGIHRSVSCLSLKSGNRSYDHIQSKVKEYILNIKESEAERKRNRLKSAPIKTPVATLTTHTESLSNADDPEKLKKKICELEFELKEKSILIDTQQKQYTALLCKYAEAKNTIDAIKLKRINCRYNSSFEDELKSTYYLSYGSFNVDSSNKYFASEPNNKENNVNLVDSICNNQASDSFVPCPVASTPLCSPNQIKNLLGPVSSIFSSSSRLDGQFVPLSKRETGNSNGNGSRSRENISVGEEVHLKLSNEECRVDNSNSSLKHCSTISNSPRLKHQPIQHIDLPRVAPFDKVKKWQESLPSIDLLGPCSSPNSDVSSASLVNLSDVDTFNLDEAVINEKSRQLTRTCTTHRTKSNLQKKSTKKCVEQNFNNGLNVSKKINSSSYLNLFEKNQEISEVQMLSLPLSTISISNSEVCNTTQPGVLSTLNTQKNNKIYNINRNNVTSSNKQLKSENSLSNNGQRTRKSELILKKQETDEITKVPFIGVDETTSEDEFSSYFPHSTASTLSVDKNLKQLVKSEDSSSVSSSVLDSMNDFYSFVQKKSPKRKVNCLNYYSPCKIAKLRETSCLDVESSSKQKCDGNHTILRESRLNHLFPTNSSKVAEKFKSEENVWWKNIAHTEFKKSQSLQECLKHAEYCVTILSEGLKGIASMLDKPNTVE